MPAYKLSVGAKSFVNGVASDDGAFQLTRSTSIEEMSTNEKARLVTDPGELVVPETTVAKLRANAETCC